MWSRPKGRCGRTITGNSALLQLALGLLNVALLAPIWLQIVHLLAADLLWIAFVLLAVRALSLPLAAHTPEGALARAG